jgi:hypothetical protein
MVTKDMVDQVRAARWEEWRRTAHKLPDHHILSIELLRTPEDRTLAVITAVRHREPVQYVLEGDARGGSVKPRVSHHCPPDPRGDAPGAPKLQALVEAPIASDGTGSAASADSIALGEPPPKQEPPAAIISLGSTAMKLTFDAGEHLHG